MFCAALAGILVQARPASPTPSTAVPPYISIQNPLEGSSPAIFRMSWMLHPETFFPAWFVRSADAGQGMTCTSPAGTILPADHATNAWRATDTPRHGQDDGSFGTSGPARKILAPPSSFEAALPVFPSPEERDFQKGRWRDVAIR